MELENLPNDIELWYGMPLYAVRALLIFILSTACFMFIIGYKYDSWDPTNPLPETAKYSLYLSSLAIFIFFIQPKYWQKWTYFVATKNGLLFPSNIPERRNTTWLIVSWDKVGEINAAPYKRNAKGVSPKDGLSIEVAVTDSEKHKYLPGVRILEKIYKPKPSDDQFTVIGYSNMFLNRNKVASTLKMLMDKSI